MTKEDIEKWKSLKNLPEWRTKLTKLIKENDLVLYRTLIWIYQRQTEEEKLVKESREDNKIGFCKIDAAYLSTVAKKVLKKEPITITQYAITKNKMPKYWRQIRSILLNHISQVETEERFRLQCIETERSEDSLQVLHCQETGEPCRFGICGECKERNV